MGGDLLGGAVHKVRAVAQFSVLQKVLLYSRCALSINIRAVLVIRLLLCKYQYLLLVNRIIVIFSPSVLCVPVKVNK